MWVEETSWYLTSYRILNKTTNFYLFIFYDILLLNVLYLEKKHVFTSNGQVNKKVCLYKKIIIGKIFGKRNKFTSIVLFLFIFCLFKCVTGRIKWFSVNIWECVWEFFSSENVNSHVLEDLVSMPLTYQENWVRSNASDCKNCEANSMNMFHTICLLFTFIASHFLQPLSF